MCEYSSFLAGSREKMFFLSSADGSLWIYDSLGGREREEREGEGEGVEERDWPCCFKMAAAHLHCSVALSLLSRLKSSAMDARVGPAKLLLPTHPLHYPHHLRSQGVQPLRLPAGGSLGGRGQLPEWGNEYHYENHNHKLVFCW